MEQKVETLEQLRIRTNLTKVNRSKKWAEKQAKRKVYTAYQYLPKDQKSMVDQVTVDDIITLLNAKEYLSVCFIVGILAELRMKNITINNQQEQCLKFIQVLYDQLAES